MSLKLMEIVEQALASGADSAFLAAGQPVTIKINGSYKLIGDQPLTNTETEGYVYEAYEMARRPLTKLDSEMDDRFAISVSGVSRVCISAFRQRNSYVLNLHIVPFGIPSPEEACIPADVLELAKLDDGMVIFAGPTNSSKITTMACLIEWMNHNRDKYILTIEKPIEYMFRNDRSFICQRELGLDAVDIPAAMNFSSWQAPDVIMVSDITDSDSFTSILAAANTQPLVFVGVTAKNVSSAVVNLMSMVPTADRPSVAKDLARELQAIVFQQELPQEDGTLKTTYRVFIPDDRARRAIVSQDYYLITCV